MFPWQTGLLGKVCKKKNTLKQFTMRRKKLFPSVSVSHRSRLHPEGVDSVTLLGCVTWAWVDVQRARSHAPRRYTSCKCRSEGTTWNRCGPTKSKRGIVEKAYSLWVLYSTSPSPGWKNLEPSGAQGWIWPLSPSTGNDCILLMAPKLKILTQGPNSHRNGFCCPTSASPGGPIQLYPLLNPLWEAQILIKKHYEFLE